MKMCLAPCFKGCSDEEYAAEVNRVRAYFDSAGDSLTRELAGERDSASARLAFEDAAAIHARVEKLEPILSQLPEIVQRLDRLSALMIQPSELARAVTFFRVECGRITGPIPFLIQSAEHAKSQSMESRVQETLDSVATSQAKGALESMEHLALLKRWYYRGSRIGEIFFADAKGELPMRRIVRGISRVFRGEKAEAEAGKTIESGGD
jgi:excinuclease UvrABC nuclease subunit